MDWRGRRESGNLEDRRGGGRVVGGGVSVIGLVVAFVAWKFFGVDPQSAYNATTAVTQGRQQQTAPAAETAEQREARQFVATVLADTEDVWSQVFQSYGKQYAPPGLVLYNEATRTGCGTGQAAMGPFYCPSDQKVYLDTTFFREMRTKMGINGDQNQSSLSRNDQAGDFALAYVIAHEVGHHVQTLLGVSQKVNEVRANSSEVEGNQLLVRLELQADCFAGLWANKNQQRTNFLQPGDVEEALDAAEKIGDDYLQRSQRGMVVPDSFTHGTSAQRERWFRRGLESGDINQCDTFSTRDI